MSESRDLVKGFGVERRDGQLRLVDEMDGPQVELLLIGGPFDGRRARWHDHPVKFAIVFGSEGNQVAYYYRKAGPRSLTGSAEYLWEHTETVLNREKPTEEEIERAGKKLRRRAAIAAIVGHNN